MLRDGNTNALSAATTRYIPAYENISVPFGRNNSALTTVFTPTSSCLSDLYELGSTLSAAWQATGCHASNSITAYSPGLCYSGYEPAISYRNIFSGTTETVVECCPSGMSYDIANGCATAINGGKTLNEPGAVVVRPTSTSTIIKTIKQLRAVSVAGLPESYEVTATAVTTMTAGHIYAPAVEVRFQSSDSDVSKTWSSIFAAYASVSTIGPVRSSPTNGSVKVSTTPSTVAAIALGAVLGILLLCGTILLCLRRRHRAAQEIPVHSKESTFSMEQAVASSIEDVRHIERGEFRPPPQVEAQEMQAPVPLELPTYAPGQPRSVSSRAGLPSRSRPTTSSGMLQVIGARLGTGKLPEADCEAVSPIEP